MYFLLSGLRLAGRVGLRLWVVVEGLGFSLGGNFLDLLKFVLTALSSFVMVAAVEDIVGTSDDVVLVGSVF